MVLRARLLAVLCLGFAGFAHAQDFEIKVNLFEGDPKGSKEAGTKMRVAAPTMVTKSGEEGRLQVGGQVQVGANLVAVGQQVHVVAKDVGHGAIFVSVMLESTTLSAPKGGQVSTTKAQTAATVQSGGTMRLELGEDPKNKRWVEVTIRRAK